MTESILAFPAPTEGTRQPAYGARRSSPMGPSSSTSRSQSRHGRSRPGSSSRPGPTTGRCPARPSGLMTAIESSVTFHNELPMGTDVHFHGVRLENQMDGVAPLTQPLIEPGDSFTYTFVAEGPAVSMYPRPSPRSTPGAQRPLRHHHHRRYPASIGPDRRRHRGARGSGARRPRSPWCSTTPE